jgi:predicted ester cyclase
MRSWFAQVMTGTQQRPFIGVSSDGRRLSIHVLVINQLKDGKIVRTWHPKAVIGASSAGVSAK